MSDAAITVVAIILGVVLMFVFPLMTMADKKDDVTTMTIQTATTDFVNKARTTGKITREDYNNFVYTLNATGEVYEVEITCQKLDEDYAKKSNKNGAGVKIGDGVYLTEYNSQVMKDIDKGVYVMNEGDIITTNVKNTSKTISTQLKNAWFKVTGNETGNITASHSGMVTTTGRHNI